MIPCFSHLMHILTTLLLIPSISPITVLVNVSLGLPRICGILFTQSEPLNIGDIHGLDRNNLLSAATTRESELPNSEDRSRRPPERGVYQNQCINRHCMLFFEASSYWSYLLPVGEGELWYVLLSSLRSARPSG